MVVFDLLNSSLVLHIMQISNPRSLALLSSALPHMLRSLFNQQQEELGSFELRIKQGVRQTRHKPWTSVKDGIKINQNKSLGLKAGSLFNLNLKF